MLKRLLGYSVTPLIILVSMVALTLPCQVRADSPTPVEPAIQSEIVKGESLILGLTNRNRPTDNLIISNTNPSPNHLQSFPQVQEG